MHDVNINEHRARIIKKEDFSYYDKIYCMDLHNLQDAYSMADTEEERQKISLILEEAGNISDFNEVPDPYYGDFEDFEKVYRMLDEACETIANQLTKP